MTDIPVLAVRQPWASLIAEGHKTIEVRSTNTLKRGKIAIYASRTTPREYENRKFFKELGFIEAKRMPRGKILATADLYQCLTVRREDFTYYRHQHRVDGSYFIPGKTYLWYLENIQKVEPVDFKFNGSVIWSSIDEELLK